VHGCDTNAPSAAAIGWVDLPGRSGRDDRSASIAVDDSIYGPLSIDASIARLQVQLYDDGSQGFELDLDHAFKDRGQLSVVSTITAR
jgi:hypothetical protein